MRVISGASHLRRILPESPAAHHRVEGWEACEAVVSGILPGARNRQGT
jgi:hypothetical protein